MVTIFELSLWITLMLYDRIAFIITYGTHGRHPNIIRAVFTRFTDKLQELTI